MLESAAKLGITLGTREHPTLPVKYRRGPNRDYDYAMTPEETGRFFGLFAECGHPVGFEFDYLAGEEEEISRQIAEITDEAKARGLRVSGIHGSVHLLPGSIHDVDWDKGDTGHVLWDLNEDVFKEHLRDRGAERLLKDYFGAMRELVSLKIYDTLSHIDLIRKFDRYDSSGESVYFSDHEKLYERLSREIIELVSEGKMAVEINTAGIFSPIGRPYITVGLLRYAAELGVPVSVGSDAHVPERIGAGFDIAARMIEEAGVRDLVTFMDRKPVRYSP